MQTRDCYVIAEIGVNHNGCVDRACELVDVVASSGANAAKFQVFDADALVSASAEQAQYQTKNMGEVLTQREMLRSLELDQSSLRQVAEYCEAKSIEFLATPFGIEQADQLLDLGVRAFKVSSGDLTYDQLLAHLSASGLPIILSTGMATLDEVRHAITEIERNGPSSYTLLHCVSDYPAQPEAANLLAIRTMLDEFDAAVGWSDHTVGSTTSIAAVALGATVIEKHLTLDRSMPGPDHAASLEPSEFAEFVEQIRTTCVALGDGIKQPHPSEFDTMRVARRSVISTTDLAKGATIGPEDVAVRRPGTGLPPAMLETVIGAVTRCPIPADTPIEPAHLESTP